MAKKKKVSAEVEAVVEKVIPEFLETGDMLRISDIQNAAEKSKLTMHIFEQELAKKQLEIKLKEHDVQQTQIKLQNQAVTFKERNKALETLITELRAKYDVKGEFAFDPLSGKIIR